MIELFTRKPDSIELPEEAVLSPLPLDENISSLSAILLDDDYYEFLKHGRVRIDGVTVLDAPYLIPFKAKAWMDLSDKKAAGRMFTSFGTPILRRDEQAIIHSALTGGMEQRQANGTKCTIVTWHPDAYGFGKSEARMALLERLRKAGFEIYYVEKTCEHFAVIDRNIVWYGSMDLLAKPDVEDNLMRVCSSKIVAELLELTFGDKKNLQEW